MELSTYALIIGILQILFAVPLLFHPKETGKWIGRLLDEEIVLRVVGAFFVVISFLALSHGYAVSRDPAGLVRLLAWVILVKWLMITWWPHSFEDIKKRYMKHDQLMLLGGVAALCLGLLLVAGSVVV